MNTTLSLSKMQRALALHLIPWAAARAVYEELARMRGTPGAQRAITLLCCVIFLGEDVTDSLQTVEEATLRALYQAQEATVLRFRAWDAPDAVPTGAGRPSRTALPLAQVRPALTAQLESWQHARERVGPLVQGHTPEGRDLAGLLFRLLVMGEALGPVVQSVPDHDAARLNAVFERVHRNGPWSP